MIKQCAIYTRTAIKDQDVGADLRAAENFIEAQPDAWVFRHYHDNGYSGRNMVRPAILRLMRDIRAGRIDAVIVMGVDRISCDAADFCEFAALMNEHNVRLVTLRHGVVGASSTGNLLLTLLAAFAQYQDSLEREVA